MSETIMAPSKVAWLCFKHTVVQGKWKKWKSHIHCTSTANFILILTWFPLLVKLVYPLNASLLLRFAKMAPNFIAELLLKLLAPLKVSMTQLSVEIAPLLVAALLLISVE